MGGGSTAEVRLCTGCAGWEPSQKEARPRASPPKCMNIERLPDNNLAVPTIVSVEGIEIRLVRGRRRPFRGRRSYSVSHKCQPASYQTDRYRAADSCRHRAEM